MKTLKILFVTSCCIATVVLRTAECAPVLSPGTIDTATEWSGAITWTETDDDSLTTTFNPVSFGFLPDSTLPADRPPELQLTLDTGVPFNVLAVSDNVDSGDQPTTGNVGPGSGITSGTYLVSNTPVFWQFSLDVTTRRSTYSFSVVPEPSSWACLLLVTCGFALRRRWML